MSDFSVGDQVRLRDYPKIIATVTRVSSLDHMIEIRYTAKENWENRVLGYVYYSSADSDTGFVRKHELKWKIQHITKLEKALK